MELSLRASKAWVAISVVANSLGGLKRIRATSRATLPYKKDARSGQFIVGISFKSEVVSSQIQEQLIHIGFLSIKKYTLVSQQFCYA